jgi:cytochrome c biogenesis protein CcdA/thiol-disulfide isomerase/thioredoxin
MTLLILFGFVAGAATALSPCVLPVLPIALSAGATGGQRRPLGIVTGLALSFTFATVALVYVIDKLGLPDDLLRNLAIAVLLAFGVALMVPSLAARLEAWLSRFSGRIRVARGRGDGFWSGTAMGASLGLVYTPCAGPILAGVITVSASQPFTAGRLAVALSYGIGSAVVLYFLMLGGRRVIAPLARQSVGVQVAMGAVMVIVALAMLRDYDIRFQNAIASDLPDFLVNPSKPLEESDTTRDALVDIRGAPKNRFAEAAEESAAPSSPRGPGRRLADLPILGAAPDFVGTQRWFNTPGGRPLSLRDLRGRVVVIDFWAYTCINCLRTLPYLKAWDERYRKAGLTIVGVHAPEFPFERDAANVADAIERNDLGYPVAQDNDFATWSAYGNEYWPAKYFIDARGRVRYLHFGEGEYETSERVIRELLAEAGRRVGDRASGVQAATAAIGVTTPESYLGSARADRFANGTIRPGNQDFGTPPQPPPDHLAYGGRWRISPESATSLGGSLDLNFGAKRVYLVLGSTGRSRQVRVQLDGRPIPDRLAGADVKNGVLTVSSQRLYDLVHLSEVGDHVLRLVPEPGVSGYAFTFG